MDSNLLKRAEDVFFQVVDLKEPARTAALERLCASDGTLRSEVESLLVADQTGGKFLESPALGAEFRLDTGPVDDLVGTVVGGWTFLKRLGAGGMGAVYLAERRQDDFTQRAAVKVVKRGMDSEEILKRFRQERRTLAGLEHPGIARLIDGGALPDGRPYLVMEYVEGRPVDEFCRAASLSVEATLELFIRVCEPVEVAHRSLVVHRDLKPSNILVTSDGQPKLLDFGIAKVLDSSNVDATIAEERRMTPEYASPEQVTGGPITTATDVYGLGVILFELLARRRPYQFKTRSSREVETVIGSVEPPLPSVAAANAGERSARASRAMRGDLDTIVMMALRKDPARRYQSIEQFRGDLQRYLAGMPVTARRDTLVYRSRKFVTRHKVGVAATAAIFLSLASGIIAVLIQSDATARERDVAFESRDQSEQIAEFLARMLAEVESGGREVRVVDVLDSAAERIDLDLKASPRVKSGLRSAIGRSYLGLGLYDEAKEQFDLAAALRTASGSDDPHDRAEGYRDYAALYHALNQPEKAEPLVREALAIFQRIRGESNPDTASAWNDLGAVLRLGRKYDEAEEAQRTALRIRREIDGQDAKTLAIAESLNNLAAIVRAKGDNAAARDLMSEALSMRSALLRPDHPLVLQAMKNLAVIAASMGDFDAALPMLRAVADLEKTSLGENHPNRARTLASLGALLLSQKEPAAAEEPLRHARAIQVATAEPGDPVLTATTLNLAKALWGQGKAEEAEIMLNQIDAALKGKVGKAATQRLAALELLIEIARTNGNEARVELLTSEVAALKAQ